MQQIPDTSRSTLLTIKAITLRHVLNMSSGLYPVDSFGMEYATGSGLARARLTVPAAVVGSAHDLVIARRALDYGKLNHLA
jgi:CubicO group peptidase (beta-lactamase class C family)